MTDSQFVILVLSVIGFGIAVLWQLITIYFLTPLSQIPNAGVLAPISRLIWAFIQEHRGKITIVLPKLHEELGPLIRIGPNELSYYSLDIYKAINAPGSKWTKDPRVYGQFVQDSHPGLFSITNAIEHAQRRRLMGQIFNRSKMSLLEGMMLQQTTRFLEAVKNRRRFAAVDLVPACRALESDIISCFGFGAEIGGIDEWEQGRNLDMVAENDRLSQWIALHSNLPGFVSLWTSLKTKLYKLTGWRKKTDIIMESFDEWSSTQLVEIMYGKRVHTTHPYFIETMIRSGLPAECALSEAKEMLGPGTDTTSATLAHIIWGLAHDQKYQRELYEDLAASGWPEDMTSLEAVPRLRAAVKEGIRWTAAAAAMLPRVAPPGGATLAGKYIPEGTILSSSPIWYLHDKNAFPSPHTYRPSRWLYESGNLRDEYYIPFSKGPNICIGAHFAYLELYMALSQFIKTFHVRLPLEDGYTGEATLPPRLEWVAAVSLKNLEVHLTMRT